MIPFRAELATEEAADVTDDDFDCIPFVIALIIFVPTDEKLDDDLLSAFAAAPIFTCPSEFTADLNDSTPLVSKSTKLAIKLLSLYAAEIEFEMDPVSIPATDTQ